MADETGSTDGETPQTEQTTASAATAPEQDAPAAPMPESPGETPEGEEFNPERARALIRKLRDEAKAASRQIKELDALKAEKAERERAQMTEQERLTHTLRQREAELEFERQSSRDQINQYEVQLHASRLGIVDPEAAVKLLDWKELEYGDDGRPQNVAEALNDLVERRPWLKGGEASPPPARPASSATNPATRGVSPASRTYTTAEIADRAFWNANKDDIMRAIREGRVTD